MELVKAIRERRSIKAFQKREVTGEEVKEILVQAIPAVTPGNRKPWRFIYVGSAAERMRLAGLIMDTGKEMLAYKLMPGAIIDKFTRRTAEIPGNLIVIINIAQDAREHTEDYEAVCCLMQNFQLAAWARGIGMTWSTNESIRNIPFARAMGIGEDERIVGILHMGYVDKAPKGRARTAAEKKLQLL